MASDSESSDSNTTIVEHKMLKGLIRKRGVEKAKLTLFIKYLHNFNSNSSSVEQYLDLQLRTEKLTSLFSQFERIQDEIETISTELEKELIKLVCFENLYYGSLSKTQTYLKKFTSSIPTQQCSNSQHSSRLDSEQNVKYPDISLPSFNGNVIQWIEFRDTFDALIN